MINVLFSVRNVHLLLQSRTLTEAHWSQLSAAELIIVFIIVFIMGSPKIPSPGKSFVVAKDELFSIVKNAPVLNCCISNTLAVISAGV